MTNTVTCEKALFNPHVVHPILGIFYLNFIFLMLMLIVFFSFFANPVGYEMRMPSQENVGLIDGVKVIIRITGENVLYFNDKVVTINELKRDLSKISHLKTVIDVRVDKRASMGRVADICDLCRGLGAARVKIIVF